MQISSAASVVIKGLLSQLGELPKAAAAGNLEAALQAALAQANALLPAAAQGDAAEVLVVGHRPPGTAAAASALVAEGEAAANGVDPHDTGHRPPGTEDVAAAMAIEARAMRAHPY